MGVAVPKSSHDRAIEIRVRFEPGLGAALYASLHDGEVAPVAVAKVLGRGKALLRYHGFTLMANGAPDWKVGDTFSVYVKEMGPPLVLAPVGAGSKAARISTIESAVVPSIVEKPGSSARP